MAYPIPAERIETHLEVKKSRFIACAMMAADRGAAMAVVEQARRDYPDARHHCWAYLLGDPQQPSSLAMSDDGEPSGTAGKPILNVLQHSGVGDLVVVVTRYFGGVKLGAGGLVRAYSAAAQQAIEALPVELRVPRFHCRVACGFAQEHYLRHWLSSHDAQLGEVIYATGVELPVDIPVTALDDFQGEALAQGWELRELATEHQRHFARPCSGYCAT